MWGPSTRTIATIVLVGVLVMTAGCTGMLDDGDTDSTETVESTATNAPETESTATTAGEDSGDGHGHSHGDGASDDATETDDGRAEASETDGVTETGSEVASGRMTLAVNGTELDLSARQGDGSDFGVTESDGHVWTTNEADLTLAEAVSAFDIEASESQISVDGEQYSEQDDGTTVSYRVNGEPVDPEEYVVEDRDWFWITVTTEQTNRSGPGEYIRAADQHAHGDMEFVVDGEEVDFSQEKYQSNHRHFHYEHGDGEIWHAHSVSLSLSYALSTLTDIDVDGDAIEYNGTYYDPDDEGTTIDVAVNGESVDPGAYVLKDGDSVRVEIESTQ